MDCVPGVEESLDDLALALGEMAAPLFVLGVAPSLCVDGVESFGDVLDPCDLPSVVSSRDLCISSSRPT